MLRHARLNFRRWDLRSFDSGQRDRLRRVQHRSKQRQQRERDRKFPFEPDRLRSFTTCLLAEPRSEFSGLEWQLECDGAEQLRFVEPGFGVTNGIVVSGNYVTGGHSKCCAGSIAK